MRILRQLGRQQHSHHPRLYRPQRRGCRTVLDGLLLALGARLLACPSEHGELQIRAPDQLAPTIEAVAERQLQDALCVVRPQLRRPVTLAIRAFQRFPDVGCLDRRDATCARDSRCPAQCVKCLRVEALKASPLSHSRPVHLTRSRIADEFRESDDDGAGLHQDRPTVAPAARSPLQAFTLEPGDVIATGHPQASERYASR